MKVFLENKTSEQKKSPVIDCKKTQPSQTIVHAQLEMTTPGDADEVEANAMADAIVGGGKIRRQISNGTNGSGIAVSVAMENQLAQTQGGGRAMPDGLRNIMENGFGRDFSNVRIHTDSQAVAMSENLSAKAFTLGNDIYFNKGQFSPNTTSGQHLIAHELTHVVQGRGKVGRYSPIDQILGRPAPKPSLVYYDRTKEDDYKGPRIVSTSESKKEDETKENNGISAQDITNWLGFAIDVLSSASFVKNTIITYKDVKEIVSFLKGLRILISSNGNLVYMTSSTISTIVDEAILKNISQTPTGFSRVLSYAGVIFAIKDLGEFLYKYRHEFNSEHWFGMSVCTFCKLANLVSNLALTPEGLKFVSKHPYVLTACSTYAATYAIGDGINTFSTQLFGATPGEMIVDAIGGIDGNEVTKDDVLNHTDWAIARIAYEIDAELPKLYSYGRSAVSITDRKKLTEIINNYKYYVKMDEDFFKWGNANDYMEILVGDSEGSASILNGITLHEVDKQIFKRVFKRVGLY